MKPADPAMPQEQCPDDAFPPSLTKGKKPQIINWYRTPLDPKDFKRIHQKSDLKGFAQTLGYLGLLVVTGSLAFYSGGHWPIAVTALLIFTHGTFYAFMINAVHELGHNTVFKTKVYNRLFDAFFSFLGTINYEMFEESHMRHHRYTLHPPDDLEVVLPIKHLAKAFFKSAFVNVKQPWWQIKGLIKSARGQFEGEWNLILFPPGSDANRRAVRWARIMLAGHGAIILVSICFKLWMLPFLITFAPSYGNWLQALCNNTQHCGLQDDVPDFRLCTRTFTLNPFFQFLYWHMNFHIEHHMYAAVPCYNLGKLHKLVEHDLPPTPDGLVAVWKEIAAIQRKQEEEPDFQYVAPVPQA